MRTYKNGNNRWNSKKLQEHENNILKLKNTNINNPILKNKTSETLSLTEAITQIDTLSSKKGLKSVRVSHVNSICFVINKGPKVVRITLANSYYSSPKLKFLKYSTCNGNFLFIWDDLKSKCYKVKTDGIFQIIVSFDINKMLGKLSDIRRFSSKSKLYNNHRDKARLKRAVFYKKFKSRKIKTLYIAKQFSKSYWIKQQKKIAKKYNLLNLKRHTGLIPLIDYKAVKHSDYKFPNQSKFQSFKNLISRTRARFTLLNPRQDAVFSQTFSKLSSKYLPPAGFYGKSYKYGFELRKIYRHRFPRKSFSKHRAAIRRRAHLSWTRGRSLRKRIFGIRLEKHRWASGVFLKRNFKHKNTIKNYYKNSFNTFGKGRRHFHTQIYKRRPRKQFFNKFVPAKLPYYKRRSTVSNYNRVYKPVNTLNHDEFTIWKKLFPITSIGFNKKKLLKARKSLRTRKPKVFTYNAKSMITLNLNEYKENKAARWSKKVKENRHKYFKKFHKGYHRSVTRLFFVKRKSNLLKTYSTSKKLHMFFARKIKRAKNLISRVTLKKYSINRDAFINGWVRGVDKIIFANLLQAWINRWKGVSLISLKKHFRRRDTLIKLRVKPIHYNKHTLILLKKAILTRTRPQTLASIRGLKFWLTTRFPHKFKYKPHRIKQERLVKLIKKTKCRLIRHHILVSVKRKKLALDEVVLTNYKNARLHNPKVPKGLTAKILLHAPTRRPARRRRKPIRLRLYNIKNNKFKRQRKPVIKRIKLDVIKRLPKIIKKNKMHTIKSVKALRLNKIKTSNTFKSRSKTHKIKLSSRFLIRSLKKAKKIRRVVKKISYLTLNKKPLFLNVENMLSNTIYQFNTRSGNLAPFISTNAEKEVCKQNICKISKLPTLSYSQFNNFFKKLLVVKKLKKRAVRRILRSPFIKPNQDDFSSYIQFAENAIKKITTSRPLSLIKQVRYWWLKLGWKWRHRNKFRFKKLRTFKFLFKSAQGFGKDPRHNFRKIKHNAAFVKLMRVTLQYLIGLKEKSMLKAWIKASRGTSANESIVTLDRFAQTLFTRLDSFLVFLGFSSNRIMAREFTRFGGVRVNDLIIVNHNYSLNINDIFQLGLAARDYLIDLYGIRFSALSLEFRTKFVQFLHINWSLMIFQFVRAPFNFEITGYNKFMDFRWLRFFIRYLPRRISKYKTPKLQWYKY